MPSVNLLDIDVDSLFEQFGVGDIDQVHKKLQSSIEEKKEDLRVMVGERYRDLLQAADIIGDMQHTSKSVIEHIDAVIGSCQAVNEQQLLGFRAEPKSSQVETNQNDRYYNCVAQIHLLTLLPELIWSHLDDGDYFVATQLFMLSRHISTGLQLETNNDILRKFPVARRQCAHMNQFFFTIKQKCIEQLENPELEIESTEKCLTSLLLLENCQLDKLLTMFIQLRTRAFRLVFTTTVNDKRSAKERILLSLKMLDETLMLMFTCFVDTNEHGMTKLMEEIERVAGANAKPTIDILRLENESICRSLSSLILKFKPQLQVKSLDVATTKNAIDSWIKTINQDAINCLTDVIDNIISIRTIHNINRAVNESEKPSNRPKALKQLQLSSTHDFFELFYRPLLQNRVQTIVKTAWTLAIDDVSHELKNFLDESDAKWTINKSFWNESSAENPLSLKQALSTNRDCHKLLMKIKGFNDDICCICTKLEQSAASIYGDLSLYIDAVDGDDDIVRKRQMPNAKIEYEQIVAHLQNCSQGAIMKLISDIKTLAVDNSSQRQLIYLAHALKAISEICPNVKQCLMPTSLLISMSWNEQSAASSTISTEHWDRVCRLLEEESLNLWKQWIELFIAERLESNNGFCFPVKMELIDLLSFLPKWETISVEEKDESNQSIESKIHVPNQPSIPLHQFLFICCRQLNALVPNTLPKSVTLMLVDRLIDFIAATYSQLLATNDFIATNQNASLQFYFDLKFVTLMLLAGRRHEPIQSLVVSFKGHIDPFDFELFHKYVSNNIKLAAQRMQHHFGVLMPNLQQLNSILSTVSKETIGSTEKDPNVLALCSNDSATHIWFTLLPIVVTTKMTESFDEEKIVSSNVTTKPEKPIKRSPSKSTSAQQNLANVKSNAASFFGAMSQDWFR